MNPIFNNDNEYTKYRFSKYENSNSNTKIFFTKDGLTLTASVRFPAFESVSISLILLTHSKEVDRLPNITPDIMEEVDTKLFCK